MDDDLVTNFNGSWVRPAKKSAAAHLDQLSDALEELFLAQHRSNAKSICVTSHDREGVYSTLKFNSK